LAQALAEEIVYASPLPVSRGIFLDIFGGCGNVAVAAQRLGRESFIVDTRYGDIGDVCKPAFVSWLTAQASNNLIAGAMLAPPCSSFSLAISRSGKALRSAAHPRGKPIPLTAVEKDRIELGNKSLDAAIAVIHVLNRFSIPFVFENPSSSYMWHDVPLHAALGNAKLIKVHQCAFGARWRKDTCFAFANIDKR
jgi:hypothetical protein